MTDDPKPQREVVLWPSRENYPRFSAVCDDIPRTFDEFEALAGPRLLQVQSLHGIILEKIAFDPDMMAEWCMANFGNVKSEARKYYAAFLSFSN